MYYSSFSAAAAGMFNWPVIDLLQNKDECLSGQYILSSAINKEERETWKVQREVQNEYIVYEKNMDITLLVCWFQNKLFYVIAVLTVIYVFSRF